VNDERNDARPQPDLGPALRRALERRRRGSQILLWFVIFLAVLAAGQALLFLPILSELGRRENPPAVPDVNLPERVIRVFRSAGPVRLLLKAPLDLPEADGERASDLDDVLFPGGDRHRYFLLHAVNADDTDRELELDSLVVEDSDGKTWTAVKLADALRERAGELPEFLRFYLAVRVPANGRLGLPARSVRDVLVAFPSELSPERIARARLGDVSLEREELRKDELDAFLENPDPERE